MISQQEEEGRGGGGAEGGAGYTFLSYDFDGGIAGGKRGPFGVNGCHNSNLGRNRSPKALQPRAAAAPLPSATPHRTTHYRNHTTHNTHNTQYTWYQVRREHHFSAPPARTFSIPAPTRVIRRCTRTTNGLSQHQLDWLMLLFCYCCCYYFVSHCGGNRSSVLYLV